MVYHFTRFAISRKPVLPIAEDLVNLVRSLVHPTRSFEVDYVFDFVELDGLDWCTVSRYDHV